MILTFTGNLLAERTFTYADWSPGRTQRAAAESFQVGGKGINVSKMLRRMGAPTTAWGFVGGASGAECREWLERSGIPHRLFPTSSPTRTGLVVRAAGKSETTFLGPDRAPDAAAFQACAQALAESLGPGMQLALCGSVPGWTSEEAAPLRAALKQWAREGELIVDTYGPPLADLVQLPLAWVKINRDEFDPLFPPQHPGHTVTQRLEVLRRTSHVQRWVVTDGPAPVCFAGRDTPAGTLQPPAVREVSPTGSGDVLLALLLHASYNQKLGLADALQFALPYAAANAGHPGVAEFDLNLLPSPGSLPP